MIKLIVDFVLIFRACAGLWKKLFDDGATVIAHTVTSNGRCIDELFPREHTIPCHDLKVIKVSHRY